MENARRSSPPQPNRSTPTRNPISGRSISPPGAKATNLTSDFDFDAGDSVFGDNAAPRGAGGSAPIWSADGKNIIEIYAKEGRTQLASFDAQNGAVTDLTHGDHAVTRYSAAGDTQKIVFLASTPTRIHDLFFLDRSGGAEPRQLTHVNDALFNQLKPERTGRDLVRKL